MAPRFVRAGLALFRGGSFELQFCTYALRA